MICEAESSELRVVLLLLLLPLECCDDDPVSAGRSSDAPDVPDATDLKGELWLFHAKSL